MPIYEYTCGKCNHKFEKLVRSMSDDSRPQCPSCGSKKTERAMSVFAVADGLSRGGGAPSPCQGCCGGGACPMAEN